MVPMASAGPRTACDKIAEDVREAVSKDPAKVLMIVEDALVINETCACEIIKTAIMAANADEAMVVQIVQTALAVAPKMSAVIAECATAAAPAAGPAIAALGAGGESTTVVAESPTGGGKGVVAVAPVTPPVDVPDFSNAWSTNIRGVYLVQPAAAGFITQVVQVSSSDKAGDRHGEEEDEEETVNRANSRRTRNLVPLSPTNAQP
jgi:hypothetical protein